MKHILKLPLYLFLLATGINAMAQNTGDARSLIREGAALNDQGKYDEAIAKYNQALKIDTGNLYAVYEIAYSLYSAGRGKEGIPYIEKILRGNSGLTVGAYDLLGTIYDKDNETEKAINAYEQGIKLNPSYERLHYNLGLVYFRIKNYAEAEKCAIDAIKLDPKHASAQRMYALVNFHQNKRLPAFLALCSFILLEPNTPRSAEAYNNIQHILQGGVLKDAGGNTTITLSPSDSQETTSQNLAISLIVTTAQQKKLAGSDLLEYELKGVCTLAGELSTKKTDKAFFDKYFADYFYRLSQSTNMPAFARLIGSASNSEEYKKWAKVHDKEVIDLESWLRNTERIF